MCIHIFLLLSILMFNGINIYIDISAFELSYLHLESLHNCEQEKVDVSAEPNNDE